MLAKVLDPEKIRFLLVEDDDDHAEVILRTLERENLKESIVRVKDGVAALDYIRKLGIYKDAPGPDVVLLDLKLPKKSGLEVLKELKEDPLYFSIPIVILTTSDHENDKKQAYQFHANSYLVKPLDFNSFKNLISEIENYWGVYNRKFNLSKKWTDKE